MGLATFISDHHEAILSDWVAFAESRGPIANGMDLAALRDHASEILLAIAADLRTTQSPLEQAHKSEGKSDAESDSAAPDTAAQSHGAARAESGFTIEQMVSEYRALRASVVRLWIDAAGELDREDLDDLVRFNEAIDQALAESTTRFAQGLDQSREMFLAMLGHDLRTPLGAIIGSAHIMVNTKDLPEIALKRAFLILNSGQRMNALVGDLLDFTRSRLGGGIPIVRARMDVGKVCRAAVEEIAAMHPQRVLNFDASGELQGDWDVARIGQVLSNVINNAVQHGSSTTPINVTVSGDADEIKLTVQNCGPKIPATELSRIFDPMHRIDIDGDKPVAPRENLGLGLYITERILAAHEGTIEVASSDKHGTVFTIHLPKRFLAERRGGRHDRRRLPAEVPANA